jgi:phenylalanyl-tRNA synthetase beta chain
MKVLVSWIEEFVTLTGGRDALAEALTLAGIEVEGVETRGVAMDHVVVGEILSSDKHPSADRLSVCRVDVGDGARQIVCGAKNYRVGDRVPVALPGAVLPGDFRIKESKLRGELSQGMMCSGKELGLSPDAEGLLILDPATPVGTPIGRVFPPDTVFDLEVTPNRPDLLSHFGIARELVILGLARWNDGKADPVPHEPFHDLPRMELVANSDAEACPSYTGTAFEVAAAGPSPRWISSRLEAVGLRPINALVDITNYTLLEFGHPTHVFDADRLAGGRLEVRRAVAGETIVGLDHRTHELTPADLVIADASGPVAIAGVIGGEATAVTESTRRVVLEVARFHPSLVRATRTRLGISTDSSYRFERGTDDATLNRVRARSVELLRHVAGAVFTGTNLPGWVEVSEPAPVTVRPAKVRALLGTRITDDDIVGALRRVASAVEPAGEEQCRCRIPAHRHDLDCEADFAEEVARLFGLDRIPSKEQSKPSIASAVDAEHDRVLALKQRLAAMGFFEVVTNPLGAGAGGVAVVNPMTADQVRLRTSLRDDLLRVAATNLDAGQRSLRLFSIQRVYGAEAEPLRLAVLVSGPESEPAWTGRPRELDAFDVKGVLAAVGGGDTGVEMIPAAERRALGIKQAVAFAEGPVPAGAGLVSFRAWPVLPGAARDMAVVLPVTTPYASVADALARVQHPLLESVSLVDVYRDEAGSALPADQRSLTLTARYRSTERTMTDREVNDAHEQVKSQLRALTGCEFRA